MRSKELEFFFLNAALTEWRMYCASAIFSLDGKESLLVLIELIIRFFLKVVAKVGFLGSAWNWMRAALKVEVGGNRLFENHITSAYSGSIRKQKLDSFTVVRLHLSHSLETFFVRSLWTEVRREMKPARFLIECCYYKYKIFIAEVL